MPQEQPSTRLYDELLPYVYNTSCVEAFCAAVGGFDAYAGPVS